jgi:transposase-like protein
MPGEIGALLRREGLFASQLANWRKLADKGKMDALNDNKRGTKKRKDIKDLEIEKLKAENLKLAKKLNQAEIIIDLQKKMAKLLDANENLNTGEDL